MVLGMQGALLLTCREEPKRLAATTLSPPPWTTCFGAGTSIALVLIHTRTTVRNSAITLVVLLGSDKNDSTFEGSCWARSMVWTTLWQVWIGTIPLEGWPNTLKTTKALLA